MELQNATCLITGASSGIGAALARALAAEGCNVGLFARRADLVRDLAAELGSQAVAVPGDVTSREDLDRAVAMTAERFGGLDVLINNAGVATFGALETIPLELVEKAFRINVFGPMLAYQAALPWLEKSSRGMIVNVSSQESTRRSAHGAVYSATKAALNLFTVSMREATRERGIHVMSVFPGLIANEFGRHAQVADDMPASFHERLQRTDLGRSSEEAARDIVAAMKEDAEVYRSDPGRPLEMPV